ncbi:peptide-methionine (R)-S-oxide reductase MsrB [Pseudomonas sp.]|jgi:peptide-methionine (R)-S-oxide reductase|uniref:peptide-methionine (R)-S-oxide reductase MsrB n=1 Tax=Pseudomonas sp. TaxID=306 RepID=UPI002729B3B2|nr:peptide-methionine (R)-S-oxide reductase MsrB [Pseudomonas sp.]
MKRRALIAALAALPALTLPGRQGLAKDSAQGAATPLPHPPEYWRDKVSAEAWQVLFRDGTEPAGSSRLDKLYEEGTYTCAACFAPLFRSEDKFDSGTGWPSFTQPMEGVIGTRLDFSLIWPRTEYHCIRCGGHQGHVFKDGPPPRGERWCNNGVALRFVPAGEPLPELRG